KGTQDNFAQRWPLGDHTANVGSGDMQEFRFPHCHRANNRAPTAQDIDVAGELAGLMHDDDLGLIDRAIDDLKRARQDNIKPTTAIPCLKKRSAILQVLALSNRGQRINIGLAEAWKSRVVCLHLKAPISVAPCP